MLAKLLYKNFVSYSEDTKFIKKVLPCVFIGEYYFSKRLNLQSSELPNFVIDDLLLWMSLDLFCIPHLSAIWRSASSFNIFPSATFLLLYHTFTFNFPDSIGVYLDFKNSTICNIIRWFGGLLGWMTRPSIWCSKQYSFNNF